MTRQEAIACGAKRYNGKVCAKHPEAGGERRVLGCNCTACARERDRERDRERKKSPTYREQRRKYQSTPAYHERDRAQKYKEYWADSGKRERILMQKHARWISDPEFRMRRKSNEVLRRARKAEQVYNEFFANREAPCVQF